MRSLTLSAAACALAIGGIASDAAAEGRGVRTPQAVEIFNDICGKTYPSFKRAEERTLALGLTFEDENPPKDIWISAFNNSSSGRSGCSVRYGTVETVDKLLKNLELFGKVTPTGSLTATVQYGGSPHRIEIRIDDTRKNGRIMVTLQLELD